MGQHYEEGQIVYTTHDGDGSCFTAVCTENGTVEIITDGCSTTTPTTTTPFDFTTTGKKNKTKIHSE